VKSINSFQEKGQWRNIVIIKRAIGLHKGLKYPDQVNDSELLTDSPTLNLLNMYVCMYYVGYVCVYVSMYVRMYVCTYVCMYVCMCVNLIFV